MDNQISRRGLIKGLGALGVAEIMPRPAVQQPARDQTTSPQQHDNAQGNGHALDKVFTFFTLTEAAFVEAAVARLIPSDEMGPGAAEANVALFIDHQLAGEYGFAARLYMQGPWEEGTEFQGYQTRLNPREIYRIGIRVVNDYTQLRYGGYAFALLTDEQQDEVLHGLEDGSIELDEIPAKSFFDILLRDTLNGFFADPIYGGNQDMIGWKLVGYPGPVGNFQAEITQYNETYGKAPVSLIDMYAESDTPNHGN